MTAAEIKAAAAARTLSSRRKQHLPRTVRDPEAIRRIVNLLNRGKTP